ncbi:MAG TPA: hypothetical protein VH482_01555 [Thermomicrobiales bacterium]|jgi:hypothetical protein
MDSGWSVGRGLSRRSALTRVGAGGLGAALAIHATAAFAQEAATPAAMTGHPVVGAWAAITDVRDPNGSRSLFIFHADGTYSEADADGTDGYGAWSPTGDSTADVTILSNQSDEKGAFFGQLKVRASVQVAADGQTFTAPYTLEFLLADGSQTGEYGPGTATATRITVEAMGTPKGSVDDLFASLASPEATPSA